MKRNVQPRPGWAGYNDRGGCKPGKPDFHHPFINNFRNTHTSVGTPFRTQNCGPWKLSLSQSQPSNRLHQYRRFRHPSRRSTPIMFNGSRLRRFLLLSANCYYCPSIWREAGDHIGSFFASRGHDFTGFLRKRTEVSADFEGDLLVLLNE
jgi:hypothetical protein